MSPRFAVRLFFRGANALCCGVYQLAQTFTSITHVGGRIFLFIKHSLEKVRTFFLAFFKEKIGKKGSTRNCIHERPPFVSLFSFFLLTRLLGPYFERITLLERNRKKKSKKHAAYQCAPIWRLRRGGKSSLLTYRILDILKLCKKKKKHATLVAESYNLGIRASSDLYYALRIRLV